MTKSFIIASFIFIAVCFLGAIAIPKTLPDAYIHNDAYIYWIGSRLFWEGQSPYGISQAFQQLKDNNQLKFHWASGYSYPPFLALVFIPLASLPPNTAVLIWFVCNICLYVFFVWRVTQPKTNPWLLLYLFTFAPVLYSIFTGQVNIVVLLALYGYAISPNSWQGALGLALASILKVYPLALLLISVIQKLWQTLVRVFLFVALFVMVPIIVMGVSTTQEYLFHVLPKLQHNFDGYFTYQSFNSVLQRLTGSSNLTLPSLMFTIGMVLYLLYFAYRHQNQFQRTLYVWIAGLTLAAGTNTFWNFTPTLLGNLYLIKKWPVLSRTARGWFIVSIILSNVLWHATFLSVFFNEPSTVVGRIPFTFLTSFGFLYGVIQLGLLTQFDRDRNQVQLPFLTSDSKRDG